MKDKILFFLHLPPPFHGVSLTNERIIQSKQIEEGFEIKVLPISYNQQITSIGRFQFKKLFKYLMLLAAFFKELLLFGPEFVYFSMVPCGLPFYRDAVFVILSKCFRKKILLHLHGVGIHVCIQNFFPRLIYRLVFQKAHVILQSQLLLPDLSKIKNNIQKIYIVHNAIPARINPIQKKAEKKTLTFINVSTVIPAKGQIDILKAAKRLLDQGLDSFKIVFIGQTFDSQYALQMENYAKQNQMEEYIDFKGPLFGEAKEKILEEADVFLFPTYNESFGLVSLEAMRAGLPVIATNVGSLPEIVKQGSGFLYPPGSIEQLASHMGTFIKERPAISKMGQKALETFKENFTFEIFEQKMRNVFLDVLQSPRQGVSQQLRD